MSKTDPVQASNIAEARGDWSGLKGSYFHLLYAAKLALADGLKVSFFEGNDLAAFCESDNKMLWIQLKSTEEDGAWGIYSIIREATLFPTLVRNALQSRADGRNWQAQLATTASIKKGEIEKFIADPSNVQSPPARKDGQPPLPTLSEVFTGFVASCHQEWNRPDGSNPLTVDDVRTVAQTVLQQIADSPHIRQSDLEHSIDLAIAQSGFDVKQSGAVRQAIIGAVSRKAAPTELQGVTVDREWFARTTGYERLAFPTLMQNPVEASACQVRSIVQQDWRQDICVDRPDLHEALDQFMESNRSLFIITGESGTGKTWAMAYEAVVASAELIRAFLPADAVISKGLVRALADEFRACAHAQTTSEEIVRHLTNGAATLGRGPMLVYVDDLGVYDSPLQDASRLIQVARDAEVQGIKVVLSMRYGVWYRLSRVPAVRTVAYLRSQLEGQEPKPSFEMPPLGEEELAKFVRNRRPPSDQTETLIRWLQQPSQGALRNGYLLGLFLDQYPNEPNQPVQIDSLLDEEYERRACDLANRANIDEGLASDAMNALAAAVWSAKPKELSRADAIQAISATGISNGDTVLAGLQTVDVLAPSGSLRTATTAQIVFSNPQLAERALVRQITKQDIDVVEAVRKLKPGVDDGVVAILARSGIDTRGVDPVGWAEAVIEMEPDWIPAVCRGLSQRSQRGWRIPALLSALANAHHDERRLAASFALGDMTYHSEEARAWLEFQCTDERGSEGFMARLALGQAIKSHPSWTVELIQARLGQVLSWTPKKKDDRERRARYIRNALDPMAHLSDARAARLAVRVLRHLRRRDPIPSSERDDVRWSYEYDVNSVRGAAAAFGGGSMYEGLIAELRGKSLKRRRRSAYAARMFASERPDDANARSALLEAFSLERGHWPLYLWALYTYARRSPLGIADAIHKSEVLQNFRAGLALVICGLLAEHDVAQARELLPRDLSAFRPKERSLLVEPFAFAWTLVGIAAPQDETARGVLSNLAEYDHMAADSQYACFTERGAAVAQLGIILLSIPDALTTAREAEVYYHYWCFELNQGFAYVELKDIYAKFGSQILAHQDSDKLINRLVDSISLVDQFVTSPLHQTLMQWRFRVENLCSDELGGLVPHLSQPVSMIDRLPQSWHAIRACRGLLGTPHETEGVESGLELCRFSKGIPSDAENDRTAFLLELSRRGLLPDEWRDAFMQRGFDQGTTAKYLLEKVRNKPASILDELHATFTPENAIRLAFDWSKDAMDWRSQLFGRVFIFSLRRPSLTELECLTLLTQMREVIEALPSSTLRDSYLETLEGIERIGRPNSQSTISIVEGDRLLDRALRAAGKVVTLAQEKGSGLKANDLRQVIAAGDGFVYDKSAKLNDSSVSHQMGRVVGTFWYAPLPHIALTMASIRLGIGNFAEQFSREWLENEEKINALIHDVFNELFDQKPSTVKRAKLQKALRKVCSIIGVSGPTAKLDDLRRHLLLLSKQFDRAKGGLWQKAPLPSFGETEIGHGDYNRACVAARAGLNRRCRFLLEKIRHEHPELVLQAVDDPDLQSLRRLHWFKRLTERP